MQYVQQSLYHWAPKCWHFNHFMCPKNCKNVWLPHVITKCHTDMANCCYQESLGNIKTPDGDLVWHSCPPTCSWLAWPAPLLFPKLRPLTGPPSRVAAANVWQVTRGRTIRLCLLAAVSTAGLSLWFSWLHLEFSVFSFGYLRSLCCCFFSV